MQSYLRGSNVCKIPDQNTLIYKDECLYCFDTVESHSGLYICMNSFIGVCRKHLDLYHKKSTSQLFLNIRIEKRVKLAEGDGVTDDCTEYQKMIKEAFLKNNVDSREFNLLLLMPSYEELALPCDLPDYICSSVKRILSSDSVAKSFERGTQGDNWEGNYMSESKYALSLKQLDNGVKVPPSGWKCYYCDLTSNLWMNLTDGTILCGRKFFDGSGGNNHAIEHYQKTKNPLAVKLGTITPKGADVFSYAEDDMVIDPLLSIHLAHFGIDIMTMEKTEKSTEELALDNMKLNRERMAIMEAESVQEPLFGPGLTGIVNTGNSCYMNSVLQVLFSMPSVTELYTANYCHDAIMGSRSVVSDDVADFRVQMAKLGYYLQSGEYSVPPPGANDTTAPRNGELVPQMRRISPQLLRYIIGKSHQDFSTKQQQDAFEYLMHVLNFVKTDVKKNGAARSPLESVGFKIEDRIYCHSNGTVKYQYRDELVLSLSIPLDQAINRPQIEAVEHSDHATTSNDDIVRPIVALQSCLDNFMHEDSILDYMVNGKRGVAFQSSKLETFPEYLWVHMKRFTVGIDWTPKKLDVEIEVPDRIDLASMRAGGLQAGEIEMKDAAAVVSAGAAVAAVELDESIVRECVEIGFPVNACKRAVYLTGNRSLEEAANWLMMHIGEPDFEELPDALAGAPGVAGAVSGNAKADVAMPDESDVEMMQCMGFSRAEAVKALQETGNLERAADWAFSHPLELAALGNCDAVTGAGAAAASVCGSGVGATAPGPTTYTLCAMISHMGNNAHVGHYVAHVKQHDGSWVLFNDESVQRSNTPPKKFAYLYLFKRD